MRSGSQLPPRLISLDKMWLKLVSFECLHPLLCKALNLVWFLDKTVSKKSLCSSLYQPINIPEVTMIFYDL